MNQEIEKCLKTAQEAKDAYIAAYKRWFEKNRAWEMIVVAVIADGTKAQNAWVTAASLETGRDALDLLRAAEIDKEATKYSLELALSTLKATIYLK